MRRPLMRRPRALHLYWEDHRYVVRDEHGKLIAATHGTFLVDHATAARFLCRARVALPEEAKSRER